MRLYFTRHGESEANTQRIISNRDLIHALTAKGRLQAGLLAEKLHGKSIAHIYTSPIPRARETAEILSAELGALVECVDALREPDCGVLEGHGDEAAWQEHDFWKESWLLGHEQNHGPQNGETCEGVKRRLTIFIETLVAHYGKTTSEFVLVTHGALILYGLPGLIVGVDHKYILDHGLGYTVLITTELQNGKLICVEWR